MASGEVGTITIDVGRWSGGRPVLSTVAGGEVGTKLARMASEKSFDY